jgi:hypothetical protein
LLNINFLIESVHKAGKIVWLNYEEPLKDHCELQLHIHKVSSDVKAPNHSSQIALSTPLLESNHEIGIYVSIDIPV